MKKYKIGVLVANLLILLVYFNSSIFQKEELLKDGQLVLLELAPVDPRSLMQGDYMRLSYAITQNNLPKGMPKRGYCVIKLDENQVAYRERVQEDVSPVYDGEYVIRYNAANLWSFNIGAESYFFQEGKAEKYENAKYGGLKVDRDGHSLLVGLYDEERRLIE